MPEDPMIEDAVAIVPVSDVRKTVDFFVDVLGFEERFVSDDQGFAIVLHGEAALHFVKARDTDSLKATANHISVYLWAKHVDALYEILKPKLDALPEGRVRSSKYFDCPLVELGLVREIDDADAMTLDRDDTGVLEAGEHPRHRLHRQREVAPDVGSGHRQVDRESAGD